MSGKLIDKLNAEKRGINRNLRGVTSIAKSLHHQIKIVYLYMCTINCHFLKQQTRMVWCKLHVGEGSTLFGDKWGSVATILSYKELVSSSGTQV